MSLILVVDDMAVFREPIAASLRLAGYETICAEDGEEALQLARLHHPNLILLDVSMPKVDGLTFLKRLHSEPCAADVRVILLTALSEKKHVLAAAALGVKDYLLKSRFRLKDLLERIEKLLASPTSTEVGEVKLESVPQAAVPKLNAAHGPEHPGGVGAPESRITHDCPQRIEDPQQNEGLDAPALLSSSAAIALTGSPLKPAASAKGTLVAAIPKKEFTSASNVAASVGEKPKTPILKGTGAQRSVAPLESSWPHLLTREQTMERLDAVAGGKTIAGVVAQMISVASSPNSDLSDVVRVIQSDPVLASRVLMLANSAATGSRARVSNVEDAARTIGVRGIQNMAIGIGIFGTFPPNEQDGFNTMRCWQHSFAVGALMGQIMRQRNPEQEGLSHLVGLCHDLGEIMLRQHFAAERQTILAYAMDHHLPIQPVEAAALGIRHPELISRLLSKMGLPPNVVHMIREYYDRQVKEHAAGISPGAQLLNLANIVAHGMQLAASTQETVRPITRTEWRILSPEKPPPTIDPRAKRDEILTSTNILARLPAGEEHRLLTPLIDRTQLRIAYVRPEIYIELDPLAFALESICDLTIVSALPTQEELPNFDGLVLVAIRQGLAPFLPEELARLKAAAKMPRMPILALVSQAGTSSCPVNDSLTQHNHSLRLFDIQVWMTEVKSHREELARLAHAA